MPAMKHVHWYERIGPRDKPKFWRCWHPDCTHRISDDEITGKRTQCECGEKFIIDPNTKQRQRPKCLNCQETQAGRKHRAIKSLVELDDLFKDVPDVAEVDDNAVPTEK